MKLQARRNRYIHTFHIVALGILLSLAVFGCNSTPDPLPTDFETAPLMGMVYSTENLPVYGMTITLDELVIVETDIEGRFIFPRVAKGEHAIYAEKAGFETIEYTFKFSDRTQVLHLQTMSNEELLHRMESAIDRRDWQEVDKVTERIGKIGTLQEEFLYLAAVAGFLRGDREQVQAYLKQLSEAGVRSKYIDRLVEMSGDDATFDMYRNEIDTRSNGSVLIEEPEFESSETETNEAVADDDASLGTTAPPAKRQPTDDTSMPAAPVEAPPIDDTDDTDDGVREPAEEDTGDAEDSDGASDKEKTSSNAPIEAPVIPDDSDDEPAPDSSTNGEDKDAASSETQTDTTETDREAGEAE